jgi:hypothetical protein
MGRWAQRQIRGGGPPTPPVTCVLIIEAIRTEATRVNAILASSLLIAGQNPANFTVPDDAAIGNALVQVDPSTWEVTFDAAVTVGNDMIFTGTVAGLCTPQTVPLTD